MSHPYEKLTPDTVLNAIDHILEPLGWLTSGHQLALNSYENRVYQIGIEEQKDVVAKFYRPGRWSRETILQEHEFTLFAKEDELPVVAPMVIDGESLFEYQGFYIALFPKQGGHSGHIEHLDEFEQMGRLIARLHQTANAVECDQRGNMTPQKFARDSRQFLLDNHFIDDSLLPAYETLSLDICNRLDELWNEPKMQLVHGDLHASNLIWFQEEPYMLDLDDCIRAPRIQDMWMLLNGDRDQMQAQLAAMARGYEMFLPFPVDQVPLIEVLRTMRLMHYSAWLAKRWDDPAFKMAFPWFNTPRYWSEEILNLREQFSALQEPPLQLIG
ncbi:serine/threonine protein kinase [Oceaniserpentilla sp. 4NH20-0058]|uniref:serine/threonine protein kinase n=1 Tax=Oceaniserpentilla sp. 4NH20-0058 TaxID=3127660 RepID=UPI0031081184